jgi:hypothetical protein
MAATLVDSIGARFAGGGTPQTLNITVAGTAPGLVVHVSAQSLFNDSQYATGVQWSLGGGQNFTKWAEKRNTVDATDALTQTWVRAAPTAGAGTVTVTFNVTGSSRDCHIVVELWNGVDAADPFPSGDIIQKDTNESPSAAIPANLVVGDGTSGVCCVTAGGITSAGVATIYSVGTNPITTQAYAYDTAGDTWTFSGIAAQNHAITAIRIKAATVPAVPEYRGPSSPTTRVRLRQF